MLVSQSVSGHSGCLLADLCSAVQSNTPLLPPLPASHLPRTLLPSRNWEADDSWLDMLRNSVRSALLTSRCCQD